MIDKLKRFSGTANRISEWSSIRDDDQLINKASLVGSSLKKVKGNRKGKCHLPVEKAGHRFSFKNLPRNILKSSQENTCSGFSLLEKRLRAFIN